jgi:hypothetical protein
MGHALEIRKVPPCEAPTASWIGRLRARLFGASDRQKLVALRHCSQHFLRDIGLSDDVHGNGLLRDEVFRR